MSALGAGLLMPDGGGDGATRRLVLRLVKKLARDLMTLPPAAVPAELGGAFAQAAQLVRRLGEANARGLFAVLRRPQVHVLLTCAWRAIEDGNVLDARARTTALLVQLGFELALEGALPEGAALRVPVPAPDGVLRSPSRRLEVALPRHAGLRFENGFVTLVGPGTRVPLAGPPSERFPEVAPGAVLALVDNNPISDFEAHPDKQGNALSLGDAPASAWTASIAEGLALVGRWLPDLREEMGLVLQQLVPVGTDDEKHLSASYREAIGTVYLTLHPRLMTMTEALIHEYQHNKVNMLFHVDPVLHNAYWPLYTSPVRPDPRPLHGVLLAAHAFLPVAELYRRMMEAGVPEATRPDFVARARQIVQKNASAMATLEAHAEPTDAGRVLLAEMTEMNRRHLAWMP